MNRAAPQPQSGFTLVELIMVIIIMGVIGGMVSVFMKSPIDAYFDSARRAALTDTADTTARRMARDIRKSLPNSIRPPTSGNSCFEFIPTKTGGRYRVGTGGAGDLLDFAQADDAFSMLAPNPVLTGQRIVVGDLIAIYNLRIPGADAYESPVSNWSAVASGGAPASLSESGAPPETFIRIGSIKFPFDSPEHRFSVIPQEEQVVRYVCTDASIINGKGNGRLYRQVLALPLAASSTCPTTASSTGVLSYAIMATNVSSCNFDYSGSDLQRNALIRMTLQLTDSGETVSLMHEVHVDNTP